MKVKDLIEKIREGMEEYHDFLDWDVYTEQLQSYDRKQKKRSDKKGGQGWAFIKDSEGWEYFKCEGFFTTFEKEKIFTINVNY